MKRLLSLLVLALVSCGSDSGPSTPPSGDGYRKDKGRYYSNDGAYEWDGKRWVPGTGGDKNGL